MFPGIEARQSMDMFRRNVRRARRSVQLLTIKFEAEVRQVKFKECTEGMKVTAVFL